MSRQGAGRGLAEHWGSLKYTQALAGSSNAYMRLSIEGKETAEYYKALQSKELGIGFALALAKQILSRRYPRHFVSIVHADTALRAGWAKLGHYRPQFFAEVWRPREPSRVFPIRCKGNHSNAAASHDQLASASAHVEAVHIGSWNETPSLIFSTEISVDSPLTIHALHSDEDGGWLNGSAVLPDGKLDHQIKEENFYPGIQPPGDDSITRPAETVSGFHVPPERFEWFHQVLSRTAAAALTAFTGDGNATAQYLTRRQGKSRFGDVSHPTIGSVRDAQHKLLDISFVGTDHVFRLNGTRVEAFSGVAEDLFEYLKKGHVEQYRSEAYARRSDWPVDTWDAKWDGPVSVHPDGSVLAMRMFRPEISG
ncbi:hypothetical protein Airi02_065420 [Actinoallomurus iriomotensis]|uniref:Uncharacterized protein n=1 Tax=Actinoallomurus iriomotensis TaxID=478107 RepID=A0A9W6VX72_9ACTN|nr:hypothetical protein Airi02_065420 [Actinoallomurus iriomotensis]